MKVFYRIEHKETGLGPFRSLKEDERFILAEHWQTIPFFEEAYPAPQSDPVLQSQRDSAPRGRSSKFCFFKESDIYDCFGSDLVKLLIERGYIIKEYVEGIDFDTYLNATNSVMIFFD
jgi:hypothetical protein